MKKLWIYCILSSFVFFLIGCSNETVIHQKANLIVTNYSDIECKKITITNTGNVVASTNKPISDTQLCYFNINTKETNYAFEIDVEYNGEHFTEDFVGDFSKKDNVILIGVNYSDGSCEIFIDQKEGQ